METSELLTAVSSIGFPAVTCWFVLYRIEYSMRKLEKTVYELGKIIAAVSATNHKEA